MFLRLFAFVIFLSVLKISSAQTAKGASGENLKAAYSGITRAVIVGVSQYLEVEPDLQYADKDAAAFSDYLKTKSGGEVPADNIRLLTNEQATTANIITALEWLKGKSHEGDRAIFYFSGHGDVEKLTSAQNGYLLTYNSPKLVYIAGALPVFIVKDYISTLSENKVNVVMISDACHSGKLSGGNEGVRATAASLQSQWGKEIKILSAQPEQLSLESKDWGGGRGVFSYYLVNGLYGLADKNNDATVSLTELEAYVTESVMRDSKEKQEPIFDATSKYNIVMGKVNPAELAKISATVTSGNEIAMNVANEKGIPKMEDAADLLNEVQGVFNKYLEGKNFLKKEDFQTAYAKMKTAMKNIDKKNPMYNTYHAQELFLQAASLNDFFSDTLLEQTDYLHAIEILDSAEHTLPDAAYIYQMKAQIYHELDDDKKIAENLLKAHELSLKWIEPIYLLANFYYTKHDFEKAKDYLEEAISLDSTLHMLECTKCTYNLLGNIYADSKKPEKALENYRKAIAIDTDFFQPYESSVEILCKQKKYSEATALAEKLWKYDSIEAVYNLTMIAMAQKKYEEAEDWVNVGLSIEPKSAELYALYGYLYQQQKMIDEALEYYRMSVELDADNYSILETMAYLSDQYSEEIESFDSLIITSLSKCASSAGKRDLAVLLVQYYSYQFINEGKKISDETKAELDKKVAPYVTLSKKYGYKDIAYLKKTLGALANMENTAKALAGK